MTCKWDREAEDYLIDGEPCRRDDYGDPTRHCTARRTCSVHIGADELTCPRCIGRARAHLRRIPDLAAFMLPIAVTAGVQSPAANLAGPAADPEAWMWHRVARRKLLIEGFTSDDLDALQAMLDAELTEEDDRHPLSLLGRWTLMIAEDYGHDLPPSLTIAYCADYLERLLPRIANDEGQDFGLLATDLRKCRRSLEIVAAVMLHKERGAPCPDCLMSMQERRDELLRLGVPEDEWPKLRAPKLVREYGHWCDREDCEQIHYDDDTADVWVCPKNREHTRTPAEYDNYLSERMGA